MTQDPTPLAFRDAGEGWHLRPRRLLVVRLASVLVAVGLTAAAAQLWGEHPATGPYLLLLAVAFALAPLGQRVRRAVPARLVDAPEGRGLLVPVRAESWTFIASAVLFALALWLAPLVALATPGREPLDDLASRAAATLLVVVSLGAGALAALGAYAGVRSRMAADRGILLLPDRVVLRTQRRPVSFAWEAVGVVRAHWTRVRGLGDTLSSPDDMVQSWFTFEVEPGAVDGPTPLAALSRQPHPTLEARLVGTDPDLALALCRYYLEHPAQRGELDGEAALERAAGLASRLAISAGAAPGSTRSR